MPFSASAFVTETEPAIRARLVRDRAKEIRQLPLWARPMASAIWGPLLGVLVERIIRAVLLWLSERYEIVPKGEARP